MTSRNVYGDYSIPYQVKPDTKSGEIPVANYTTGSYNLSWIKMTLLDMRDIV